MVVTIICSYFLYNCDIENQDNKNKNYGEKLVGLAKTRWIKCM